MKCVVFGAGAVGSLLSGYLARSGVDCTLIGRSGHVQAVNEKGLRICGAVEMTVRVPALDSAETVQGADLLMLTTKSYDTMDAMKACRHFLQPHTRVLSLQNGMGNEDVISGFTGHVIGGVTSNGVVFEKEGEITYNSPGSITLGNYSGDNDDVVYRIQEMFRTAGLPCDVSDSIRDQIFKKFIVNVGVNGLASIVGVKNGVLISDDSLQELFLQLISEAVAVGRAKGFHVPDTVVDDVVRIVGMVAENTNSMLQDLRKGKKTEIDYFNGKVVQFGREAGIATPCNAVITNLVTFIEKKNS